MKKNRVIEFDPRERMLEKAKKYVSSIEMFFEERAQAVPLLLRAMKYANRNLKSEIMCVLGSFAREEVLWPLYDMMVDPFENEEIRHDAAIQLSVIGPFLKEPQPLMDRLLKEVESSDSERRLHATFAIGWEGNFQAAIPLIDRLYDSDPRVQQTAVNALCNLRDDRVLNLLLERLDHGPLEQKRIILFNLWRFYSKKEEVTEVYLKYLDHEDAELRFDALVCLRPMVKVPEHIEVYRKCLKDKDGRVRELALKRLGEEGSEVALKSLKEEIGALLHDPNMGIKEAALKIIRRRKWI